MVSEQTVVEVLLQTVRTSYYHWVYDLTGANYVNNK
jgi:hypothetical protein